MELRKQRNVRLQLKSEINSKSKTLSDSERNRAALFLGKQHYLKVSQHKMGIDTK